MSSVVGQYERRDLDRNFGGAALFDDEIRVRVEQQAALSTPQQGTRQDLFVIGERSVGVELLVEAPVAPGAFSLGAVKCFLFGGLPDEVVGVALNGLQDQARVHRLENSHRELG